MAWSRCARTWVGFARVCFTAGAFCGVHRHEHCDQPCQARPREVAAIGGTARASGGRSGKHFDTFAPKRRSESRTSATAWLVISPKQGTHPRWRFAVGHLFSVRRGHFRDHKETARGERVAGKRSSIVNVECRLICSGRQELKVRIQMEPREQAAATFAGASSSFKRRAECQ